MILFINSIEEDGILPFGSGKVTQIIQFRLACIMFHQPKESCLYHLYSLEAPRLRTPPYFANCNQTRLSQTWKYARHQGIVVWNNLPSRLKEPMPYTNFYDTTNTYFCLLNNFYNCCK